MLGPREQKQPRQKPYPAADPDPPDFDPSSPLPTRLAGVREIWRSATLMRDGGGQTNSSPASEGGGVAAGNRTLNWIDDGARGAAVGDATKAPIH